MQHVMFMIYIKFEVVFNYKRNCLRLLFIAPLIIKAHKRYEYSGKPFTYMSRDEVSLITSISTKQNMTWFGSLLLQDIRTRKEILYKMSMSMIFLLYMSL